MALLIGARALRFLLIPSFHSPDVPLWLSSMNTGHFALQEFDGDFLCQKRIYLQYVILFLPKNFKHANNSRIAL